MIANYIEHGFEIRAKIMPNACTECPFYSYNINDDSAMCGITGTEIKTDGAQDCKRASDCPIIKAQPTVNEWTPVERELPKEEGEYLVTGKWKGEPRKYWICQLISFGDRVGWCNAANNPRVESWKPIEPYTGE